MPSRPAEFWQAMRADALVTGNAPLPIDVKR
jgi:hypothetical protein